MATVYRAMQESIGREVAIKFLMRSLLEQDPAIGERFQREAQVVASLQHPHILPVYDYGEHEGQPYLVMGILPGGTLAEHVQRTGAMDTASAMRTLSDMADALDYAHSRGVIHRDFKPGNVMLDESGRAYLTDFGLAKMISGSSLNAATVGLIGTPDYMAPDWTSEADITASVDVYSFAVSAYQMLAGEVPFRATTPMGVLMAHASSPVPDIRSVRADLPGAVSQVFERGMAKTADERYPTAGAMVRELETALQGGHASTPAPTPSLQAVGPFYYPNAWGKMIIDSALEIIGQDAVTALLMQSGQMYLLEAPIPDNYKREFAFEEIGKLTQTFYTVYGKRGSQAIARLAGQLTQEMSQQKMKAVVRVAEAITRGLPLNMAVKSGLEFLARVFNSMSDQIVEIDETDNHWIYRILRCPLCWGWHADEAVCWTAMGSLEAALKWSTGKTFRIVETECIAKGDATCTFLIDKTPLD